MPTMQTMATRANSLFSRDNMERIDPSMLEPGADLAVQARNLGIATSDYEQEYLAAFPPGLKEALRAALYSAVQRKLSVTFAWAPGYAHEISFWDVADTRQTRGGMTVFIRSPLPAAAA